MMEMRDQAQGEPCELVQGPGEWYIYAQLKQKQETIQCPDARRHAGKGLYRYPDSGTVESRIQDRLRLSLTHTDTNS